MQYRLVGQKRLWDDEEERSFDVDANRVLEAIRASLLQTLEEERGKNVNGANASYRFSMYMEEGGTEKLVMTVIGNGRCWSEAIRDAYIRVCGWQMQAPDLPDVEPEDPAPEAAEPKRRRKKVDA